ncbi:MAG: SDR family NAD(P)-dependent oxidoreductase [Verrucomicrobia bacterium]|nr:SDR family NAD(P)-dependent oxidoreductase [Verrucomicrobiota bacterium]
MIQKQFELSGKVAVVTGGSRGLGKAIARAFAEAGADVLITSRHEDDLKKAADEIGQGLARRIEWSASDMTNREQVLQLAQTALKRFGRVDILVNNAGSNFPEPIDKISDEKWDLTMELNLSSCMRLTRALVPQMMERKWGRIIHISSILGVGAKEGRSSYCATKAALIGLARSSALDLGPFNITVNCIAPGPFLTDLPMSLLSDEQKKAFADRTAVGRWGDPKELAGPALMLASDAGSYVTGTVILVDGGALARSL